MSHERAQSKIQLTDNEHSAAVHAMRSQESFTYETLLNAAVDAINALRQRCTATSGTGQCLKGASHSRPDASGDERRHFNGIVSWYATSV